MRVRARKPARRILPVIMLMLLATAAGCLGSGSEGPTTHPVTGRVVRQGGTPWAGGKIIFRSVDDPGVVATGEIAADGGFTLLTQYLVDGQPRTRAGAPAGEYTVTVEAPGTTLDRDDKPSIPPVSLRKRYRVEAGENSLVIETDKQARP